MNNTYRKTEGQDRLERAKLLERLTAFNAQLKSETYDLYINTMHITRCNTLGEARKKQEIYTSLGHNVTIRTNTGE